MSSKRTATEAVGKVVLDAATEAAGKTAREQQQK